MTARKSVGAEVNWGLRFSDMKNAEDFVVQLCGEVCRRMQEAEVKGRTFTMKLLKRSEDAAINPKKYLGCGSCDNMSK